MDKVYVTKKELTKTFNTQREKAGPFLSLLILLGLCISVLWAIPLVVFWMVYLILCIPFVFVDRLFKRSNIDE
jgi:NADH:ubiquinone oxidoreductase subunit 4 (subunit M)